MKYEWRKKDKELYLPKTTPTLITVPPISYLVIHGEGNPNSGAFQDAVSTLYSLSYGIKMAPRKGLLIDGYFDYTVFPLEGVWDLNEHGRKMFDDGVPIGRLYDHFVFDVMIRQPAFVSEELLQTIVDLKRKSDDNPWFEQAKLVTIDEGECCQIMHVGPYADEPSSFAKIDDYLDSLDMKRSSHVHREIYTTDPTRTEPARLKTVLRVQVEGK